MINKIAVVVPVYRVEKYLKNCIDSILRQTYSNFSLVLVNDGSPDNCPEICDWYASQDNRIFVIHQENGGLSAARNAGINWIESNCCDCEWITFVDSDDFLDKNCLKYMLETALKTSSEVVIVKQKNIDVGDVAVSSVTMTDPILYTPEEVYIDNSVNTTWTWEKLYKFSLYKNVRFPEGRIHEDRATTYKALFGADRIAYIADELYFYVSNTEGITRKPWTLKYSMDNIVSIEEQLEYFDKYRYVVAWQKASLTYANIIIDTLNKLREKNQYKNEYKKLKNKLKIFILKNFKRVNWKFTKLLYVLSYPLLKPIYDEKHKNLN